MATKSKKAKTMKKSDMKRTKGGFIAKSHVPRGPHNQHNETFV